MMIDKSTDYLGHHEDNVTAQKSATQYEGS